MLDLMISGGSFQPLPFDDSVIFSDVCIHALAAHET